MHSTNDHFNTVLSDRFPKQTVFRDRHLFWGVKPGRITCLLRPPDGGNQSLPGGEFPAVYPFPNEEARSQMLRDHALTVVFAGSGQLTLPDGTCELTPGSFFQLNGLPSDSWHITFDKKFSEGSIDIDGITGAGFSEMGLWDKNIVVGNIGYQPALVEDFLNLFDAIADVSVDSGTLLRSFFGIQQFIYSLHYEGSADEQLRMKASRLLADGKQWNSSIAGIAAQLGFSEVHFRRKFKQLTGLPPAQYRLKVRMEKAAELLLHHTVQETASRLGYSDPFVFSRQFKRATGISPSQRRGG